MMRAVVQGVGVVGPGLTDWDTARPSLAGRQQPSDEPLGRVVAAGLPRAEARRATLSTHLGLSAAEQALAGEEPGEALPSVWASADSDLTGLEKDVATLAEESPWISPQRFQNSVHNTPSGYWSIVTGCQGPATALSSGDESFAAGLVEALAMLGEGHDRCLLVACDQLSPPTLVRARRVPHSFAMALLLASPEQDGTALRASWRPRPSPGPTSCDHPLLERIRVGNAAARGLPLLSALAAGEAAELGLAWCDGRLDIACGGD